MTQAINRLIGPFFTFTSHERPRSPALSAYADPCGSPTLNAATLAAKHRLVSHSVFAMWFHISGLDTNNPKTRAFAPLPEAKNMRKQINILDAAGRSRSLRSIDNFDNEGILSHNL